MDSLRLCLSVRELAYWVLISGCQAGHTGLDTIGVLVTYNDTWKTPLHNLIGLMGSGWNLTQSNLMRMEPVL